MAVRSRPGAMAVRSRPSAMAVHHGRRPAHQKRIIKGKLFSQNRNTFYLESLIWVSGKAENASQSIEKPLASGGRSRPGAIDRRLCSPKKGKNCKLFSQNRNTFRLESLILGSDKAENASQSIYNPLASGGPHTHSRNGSAPLADGHRAPMAYRLGHLSSLKYTILSSL